MTKQFVTPLENILRQAMVEYQANYGFLPEKLHVSRVFERALQRWAAVHLRVTTPTYEGAEVMGLEVVQSTKRHSPHAEFWLSATRNGKVFSSHVRLEPEEVGQQKIVVPGEVDLSTSEASYDEQ